MILNINLNKKFHNMIFLTSAIIFYDIKKLNILNNIKSKPVNVRFDVSSKLEIYNLNKLRYTDFLKFAIKYSDFKRKYNSELLKNKDYIPMYVIVYDNSSSTFSSLNCIVKCTRFYVSSEIIMYEKYIPLTNKKVSIYDTIKTLYNKLSLLIL